MLEMSGEELEKLREELKSVSVEVVRLLARRADLARRVGELKKQLGIEIVQSSAERELRQAMIEKARANNLSETLVNKIATLMFNESVKVQEHRKGRQITHFDIFRRAKELERQGKRVIRLEVGEPDLGAPQQVAEAAIQAIREGYARYSDAKGLPQLRKKISEYLETRFGAEVNPENIVVSPGGRFAVYLAMKSVASLGDEIIIIDPSWPMYSQCAEFIGARPVRVKTRLEDAWTPRPEEVEEKITPATRAIVLNYPNNPTGRVISREAFQKLVDVAREHGIYVISDEVYADYSFNGEHVSILQQERDVKYVLISSFSKSWGMTGYRMGFAVSDGEVVARMAQVMSLIITCVPEFVQLAGMKALELTDEARRYAEIMRRRMETAVRELEKLPASYHKPEGGMYVFPRFNIEGLDTTEFAMSLLESKNVGLAPGTAFGDYSQYVRISLGASEEDIAEGIRRVKEYLEERGLT